MLSVEHLSFSVQLHSYCTHSNGKSVTVQQYTCKASSTHSGSDGIKGSRRNMYLFLLHSTPEYICSTMVTISSVRLQWAVYSQFTATADWPKLVTRTKKMRCTSEDRRTSNNVHVDNSQKNVRHSCRRGSGTTDALTCKQTMTEFDRVSGIGRVSVKAKRR